MMMKNKKFAPIIAIIMVILLGGGFFLLRSNNATPVEEESTKKKKTVLEPKNIIDLAMRPYVKIYPVSGGNHLTLEIVEVAKDATEVEYELEYQSGTLLQGFQEVIDLGTLPASTKKLLGSQSAGGAITYHEDIKGGSLQLRFIGPENYVLKQDWKYFENVDKETEFASKDAKFQITSEDLATNRLLIIYNTPGAPQGLEGEIASDAYVLTSSTQIDGEATVSIRANEESEELVMMGFDGEEWSELDSTVDGKVVTAEDIPLMELYVVVK